MHELFEVLGYLTSAFLDRGHHAGTSVAVFKRIIIDVFKPILLITIFNLVYINLLTMTSFHQLITSFLS